MVLLFDCLMFEEKLTGILLFKFLVLSAVCSSISFWIFQVYKEVIRHSTFMTGGRIGLAALLKAALLIPAISFFAGIHNPKILFVGYIIDVFFTVFLLVMIRMVLIVAYNYLMNSLHRIHQRDNLLILDTGYKTLSLLNTSLRNIEQAYRIAGFLRLETSKDRLIGGYKVYSVNDQDEFDEVVSRHFIKAILFPDYTVVKQEQERLIRYCEKKKIRMLVLPSVNELKDGEINYRNLSEVRIEDLLEREEIKINTTEISHSLKGKVVMVTGAAGSIGSELSRQLCSFDLKHLVLFDNAETPMHNLRLELEEKFPSITFYSIMGDVRNKERVAYVFEQFHPQVVFHAAAYKHVPLMENNPCEAVFTNVYGTKLMADLSVQYGVDTFVMISTDKAVNPTNVMGASKRMAEIYVQSLGLAISKKRHPGKTRFITTRFGNVLGSNGSVIPRFREQLAKGGPLTVTHPDIIRYFMTIPEACRLVLEAVTLGQENEIFVFDMGEPVKIANLARRMIELAGLEPDKDVKIEYTGLRPGEKLYEELLAVKEEMLQTVNEKIFRANVRQYDYEDILLQITALCESSRQVKTMETVLLMKRIIPEFKSRQSHFECLDHANAHVLREIV
jgi:FlaA1/EpsC-like NDP-sugar epimerase